MLLKGKVIKKYKMYAFSMIVSITKAKSLIRIQNKCKKWNITV